MSSGFGGDCLKGTFLLSKRSEFIMTPTLMRDNKYPDSRKTQFPVKLFVKELESLCGRTRHWYKEEERRKLWMKNRGQFEESRERKVQ